MHPLLIRWAAILLVCLPLAGCSKIINSLTEVSKLQSEISKHFGEPDVRINLNNDTVLTVTFVNSVLNDDIEDERAQRALQTAGFVKQHFGLMGQINEIWVGFMRQQTSFLVVHKSQGLGYYGFDQTGIPLHRRPEVQQSVQYSTATYVPALKQTDIVVRNMQLEGDVNNGLSVTPHYSLIGNVTAAEPSATAPKAVSLDFSSASEKSMFPGAPKITFRADQKVVYETSAQFSTSKFGEQFSESLSLAIPYAAFKRMTDGKTLVMTIGDREYVFSREQHDALVEMRAYVKE